MGQALYRKYRSKSLAEIVGQEHITDTLDQAVKSGRISHAYLFTGPRGVGKTSIARILAHQINNFDYVSEGNHLDIIEIDAASNRGIDEIRDLREKVYLAPSSGAYKVYIIDEVHMLTTQAFNALLKTLEEPPAHVVFILATTEAHKLPETIISRTQRYVFRPVDVQKVVEHLKHISKSEKIKIDDAALTLIAEHGGGSFRDSISLLDQAASLGEAVTAETVLKLLGTPPAAALQQIIETVQQADAARLVSELDALALQGYPAGAIAKQLSGVLRSSLIDNKPLLAPASQLTLLRELIDVPASADPGRLLEIILLNTFDTFQAPAHPATPKPVVPPAPPVVTDVTPPPAAPKAPKPPKEDKPTEIAAPRQAVTEQTVETAPKATKPDRPAQPFDANLWNELLTELKKHYNTLYGVMRMAQPTFHDHTLTLTFRFAFHQKRMNEAKHRKIVGDILKDLTHETIAIECLFDKDMVLDQAPVVGSSKPANDSLSAISNIFGGGELLES